MSKLDAAFEAIMHDVMNVPHVDKVVVHDSNQPRVTGTLSHNQPPN